MFTLIPVLFAYIASAAPNTLNLELLEVGLEGSQCLDGSQGGFYYQPPLSAQGDSVFVINLQGGGHCVTQASCASRTHSALGSSHYWKETMPGSGSYSNSATENPDFYDAHHIFIPYCCGDWHIGRVTKPTAASWGFYFDGHYIVKNILDVLITKYKINEAKNILIGGQSAGGIGAFMNLDFIANYLNVTQNGITIKGVPNSGWFFSANTSDQQSQPMMPPNDYQHYIVMNDSVNGGWGHDGSVPDLWNARLDPTCVSDLNANNKDSWHCFNLHTLYSYIKTPVFILNNQFDSDEITNEMAMPNAHNANTKRYVQYFGAQMSHSILNYLINENTNGNGVFLAGCYNHVTGLNVANGGAKTKINGYNSSELVGDWFWERNKLPHVVYDKCDTLPCNPTCTGFGHGN